MASLATMLAGGFGSSGKPPKAHRFTLSRELTIRWLDNMYKPIRRWAIYMGRYLYTGLWPNIIIFLFILVIFLPWLSALAAITPPLQFLRDNYNTIVLDVQNSNGAVNGALGEAVSVANSMIRFIRPGIIVYNYGINAIINAGVFVYSTLMGCTAGQSTECGPFTTLWNWINDVGPWVSHLFYNYIWQNLHTLFGLFAVGPVLVPSFPLGLSPTNFTLSDLDGYMFYENGTRVPALDNSLQYPFKNDWQKVIITDPIYLEAIGHPNATTFTLATAGFGGKSDFSPGGGGEAAPAPERSTRDFFTGAATNTKQDKRSFPIPPATSPGQPPFGCLACTIIEDIFGVIFSKSNFQFIINFLQFILHNGWDTVLDFIRTWIQDIIKFWNWLEQYFGPDLIGFFMDLLSKVLALFTWVDDVWNTFIDLWNSVLGTIMDTFSTIVGDLTDFFLTTFNVLASEFEALFNIINEALQNAITEIRALIDQILSLLEDICGLLGCGGSTISSISGALSGAVGAAASGISAAANTISLFRRSTPDELLMNMPTKVEGGHGYSPESRSRLSLRNDELESLSNDTLRNDMIKETLRRRVHAERGLDDENLSPLDQLDRALGIRPLSLFMRDMHLTTKLQVMSDLGNGNLSAFPYELCWGVVRKGFDAYELAMLPLTQRIIWALCVSSYEWTLYGNESPAVKSPRAEFKRSVDNARRSMMSFADVRQQTRRLQESLEMQKRQVASNAQYFSSRINALKFNFEAAAENIKLQEFGVSGNGSGGTTTTVPANLRERLNAFSRQMSNGGRKVRHAADERNQQSAFYGAPPTNSQDDGDLLDDNRKRMLASQKAKLTADFNLFINSPEVQRLKSSVRKFVSDMPTTRSEVLRVRLPRMDEEGTTDWHVAKAHNELSDEWDKFGRFISTGPGVVEFQKYVHGNAILKALIQHHIDMKERRKRGVDVRSMSYEEALSSGFLNEGNLAGLGGGGGSASSGKAKRFPFVLISGAKFWHWLTQSIWTPIGERILDIVTHFARCNPLPPMPGCGPNDDVTVPGSGCRAGAFPGPNPGPGSDPFNPPYGQWCLPYINPDSEIPTGTINVLFWLPTACKPPLVCEGASENKNGWFEIRILCRYATWQLNLHWHSYIGWIPFFGPLIADYLTFPNGSPEPETACCFFIGIGGLTEYAFWALLAFVLLISWIIPIALTLACLCGICCCFFCGILRCFVAPCGCCRPRGHREPAYGKDFRIVRMAFASVPGFGGLAPRDIAVMSSILSELSWAELGEASRHFDAEVSGEHSVEYCDIKHLRRKAPQFLRHLSDRADASIIAESAMATSSLPLVRAATAAAGSPSQPLLDNTSAPIGAFSSQSFVVNEEPPQQQQHYATQASSQPVFFMPHQPVQQQQQPQYSFTSTAEPLQQTPPPVPAQPVMMPSLVVPVPNSQPPPQQQQTITLTATAHLSSTPSQPQQQQQHRLPPPPPQLQPPTPTPTPTMTVAGGAVPFVNANLLDDPDLAATMGQLRTAPEQTHGRRKQD